MEETMSNPPIHRRKMLSQMTQMIAAAAGVSLIDLPDLLGSGGQSKIDDWAMLKLLLAPSRSAFESQIGRCTPLSQKQVEGKMVTACAIHYADQAAMGKQVQSCDVHLNGGTCQQLDLSRRFFCITNDCSQVNVDEGNCQIKNRCTQTCGTMNCHGANACNQDCSIKFSCKSNGPINKAMQVMFKEHLEDELVKDLMKKYGVTGVDALASALEQMLLARRATLRR
jgi:hypothetical protein